MDFFARLESKGGPNRPSGRGRASLHSKRAAFGKSTAGCQHGTALACGTNEVWLIDASLADGRWHHADFAQTKQLTGCVLSNVKRLDGTLGCVNYDAA